MSERFLASSQVRRLGYSICSSLWTSTRCQHCPLESRCIQLWNTFTSAQKEQMKSVGLGKGKAECCEHLNVAEVFISGYTTFTRGTCINLTWYTILLMFVLKSLTTNLVNDRQIFSGGWHRFCINYIRGLNCDCASPVACWTLRALPRSKKLFARYWMGSASLCLFVNASTFLRQDCDFW